MKEEKLQEAKRLYESANADQRYVLESLFPELAGSEDEKVRKEIVEYLKKNLRLEWATWLEKQGEQKLTVEMKTPEESLDIDSDTYNKIVDECIYGENKHADKVESKFKVKYAGSEYNVFETKEIAGVTFYGIEDEPNHIDYVKAENCEIIDGYAIKENGSPYPTKSAVFFGAKNPTWSKEDDVMIYKLLAVVELYYDRDGDDLDKQSCIDWLKALKQRCAWKPSDEQMATLYKYAEHNNYDGSILTSLYNDLKKLREE